MDRLNDDSILTFGKHKGKKLSEVPVSWLLWAGDSLDRERYANLHAYIDHVREVLESEVSEG